MTSRYWPPTSPKKSKSGNLGPNIWNGYSNWCMLLVISEGLLLSVVLGGRGGEGHTSIQKGLQMLGWRPQNLTLCKNICIWKSILCEKKLMKHFVGQFEKYILFMGPFEKFLSSMGPFKKFISFMGIFEKFISFIWIFEKFISSVTIWEIHILYRTIWEIHILYGNVWEIHIIYGNIWEIYILMGIFEKFISFMGIFEKFISFIGSFEKFISFMRFILIKAYPVRDHNWLNNIPKGINFLKKKNILFQSYHMCHSFLYGSATPPQPAT